MTTEVSSGREVLRGMRFDAPPLRLGRGREISAAPTQAAAPICEPEQDQAILEARALALREAREEGLRSGRAEGLRDGRGQAAAEIRQAVQHAVAEAEQRWVAELERVQRIARHAQDAVADTVAAAHDEIVALCFETLCRMLGDRSLQPETVRAQLSQLLEQHGSPGVLFHVHPHDAELLQRADDASGAASACWVADADVALGGCIVKSPVGALDARLETMLAACKSTLLEARARAARTPQSEEGR